MSEMPETKPNHVTAQPGATCEFCGKPIPEAVCNPQWLWKKTGRLGRLMVCCSQRCMDWAWYKMREDLAFQSINRQNPDPVMAIDKMNRWIQVMVDNGEHPAVKYNESDLLDADIENVESRRKVAEQKKTAVQRKVDDALTDTPAAPKKHRKTAEMKSLTIRKSVTYEGAYISCTVSSTEFSGTQFCGVKVLGHDVANELTMEQIRQMMAELTDIMEDVQHGK